MRGEMFLKNVSTLVSKGINTSIVERTYVIFNILLPLYQSIRGKISGRLNTLCIVGLM